MLFKSDFAFFLLEMGNNSAVIDVQCYCDIRYDHKLVGFLSERRSEDEVAKFARKREKQERP